MKFKQRIKKDKKFRFFFVLILLILISQIIPMLPEKKEAISEAECNMIYDDSFFNEDSFYACIATTGCYPVAYDDPDFINSLTEGIANFFGSTSQYKECSSQAEVGEMVFGSPDGCIYNSGTLRGDLRGVDVYQCIYVAPEDRVNERESEIASLADSLGLKELDPKTKYYLVIIGGGMLLMFMMSMMFRF
jgi:hypothetical protein